MVASLWVANFLALSVTVYGSPLLDKRADVIPLSAAAISAFKPYSYYASAGYCEPAKTLTWTCGSNCQANPDFEPVASGGNGGTNQYYFVGWDPALKTVIVSHQGTETNKFIPILNDISIAFETLDKTLFPGLSSNIKVHAGFKEAQADFATQVLAAVKETIAKYGATKVTTTGHSLGAAISLLDAVYLPLHLPSSITVSHIGYGSPRVGNDVFADYVDSKVASVSRITNKADIVPILPGRFLGYAHVAGEKHITQSNAWVNCPGRDNTDEQCSIGEVENIFVGKPADHSGPYDGVMMNCR